MNKGFTLIELLVVVAIMGLLGTMSVGGYRQMQRGMEERGVVDNATRFINMASERALIDRRPTAVYCWNELLRERTEDDNEIVVGRAVAVRMRGRISRIEGNCLIDEFGDLEQYNEDGSYRAANTKDPMKSRLFLMDQYRSGVLKYSIVRDLPQTNNGKSDGGQTEIYLTSEDAEENGYLTDNLENGKIVQYGYYVDGNGTASAGEWQVGSIYGMEFQSIELPHGYIFGTQYPSTMSSPIKGETTLVFDAEIGSSSGGAVGSSTIEIYSLRPGQSGTLSAQKVGTTSKPNSRLN